MYVAGLLPNAVNCYTDVAFEVYVSGCIRGCKGCHNKEMQSFTFGEYLTPKELYKKIKLYEDWFDILSFLGGDPLCQTDFEEYVSYLKHKMPDKKIYLFTGAERGEIPEFAYLYCDWIKYGPYREDLKTNSFPSSSNQGVIIKGVDYE